ncbi:hypothetical protein ATH90_3975 [Pseudomonas lurida]|uniref:hypothetical protein n=1 Tax=Pseudomonas lurida TaxID=244566 RepID=UPI000BF6C91C|nr:hypothetical protein [Pseudomonas lurida]PFG25124.1 hypothetical protein ATH90_3975 [Pseudomonas lurida]
MLYLYADGSDNDAIEAELLAPFNGLVCEWSELGAFLVNQKHQRDESVSENDLPDWFIGLNLPIENLGIEQVNRLIPFAQKLAVSTGREFALGVSSSQGISQEIVYLDANAGEHEHSILISLLSASVR